MSECDLEYALLWRDFLQNFAVYVHLDERNVTKNCILFCKLITIIINTQFLKQFKVVIAWKLNFCHFKIFVTCVPDHLDQLERPRGSLEYSQASKFA